MASEVLLEGDASTANAITEAAAIRTPHGDLSICYDERGAEYRVSVRERGRAQEREKTRQLARNTEIKRKFSTADSSASSRVLPT